MRISRPLVLGVLAVLLAGCGPVGESGRQAFPTSALSVTAGAESGEPTQLVETSRESSTPAPSPVVGERRRTQPFVPEPDRWVPRRPGPLADALAGTTRALRGSIDRWLKRGDPLGHRPPRGLVLQALYEQRIYRHLMRRPELANEVVERLPAGLAGGARTTITALATLIANVRPLPPAKVKEFRTGPPEPPGALRRYFGQGQRRFDVGWEVLAAVMYVESKFGRARSKSTAGAQGPMQFLPSTWEAYGLGGDIHDPHDAVIGAANYLHASGAPGDYRRALYAYNHSDAYVDAVLLLARRMPNDPRSYFALYTWQVYVLTTRGDVRLTGPGLE